ncbi:unnamed protein product [Periconia digitata]|uniref:Uncharacterized protein n=1 Tax=Periconia digitata TaxID=1303443 RepID=A0A9W4UUG0_9PLEO|nr:unnamed protein product [Periconia digitata]
MKSSILAVLIAPFLASAAAILPRDGTYQIKCKPDVKLSEDAMSSAAPPFYGKDAGITIYSGQHTSKKDGVKLYLCLLNGDGNGSEITEKRFANWMSEIDRVCGKGVAGWIDAPSNEGNFGRDTEGARICS